MGEPDEPDDAKLGSIKNKTYTSPIGFSLVFKNGSPYWDWGSIKQEYEDNSPVPQIAYFEDYKFI